MIVFGSSIGASYDPHTNAWQRLPPSTLAPEASSVGWIGRRLVAWDYEGDTQDYSPTTNRWSATTAEPVRLRRVLSAERRHGDEHVRVVLRQGGDGRRHTEQLGARLWRRHRPHRPVRRHTAQAIPDRLARACRGRDRARRHRHRGQPRRPVLRLQRLARHILGVPRPARALCRSVAADAPVRVIAPRCWATARERPGWLPTIRRHVHDHRSQAQTRSHHRVSRGGWPRTSRGSTADRSPMRRAGRGRSKGSSAERRHGSGTCTSRSTPGRRRTSPSPSASGGTRRSPLLKNADAARAAF